MTDASRENVNDLIATLGSIDVVQRTQARHALVGIGGPAVAPLTGALTDHRQQVRWEAAKALTDIADPSAADGLASALGDDDADVRWAAGEGLIAIDRAAIKPLLAKLTKSDLPDDIYQAAHQVVHHLASHDDLRTCLRPVLEALEHSEPEVAVPVAAAQALQKLGL